MTPAEMTVALNRLRLENDILRSALRVIAETDADSAPFARAALKVEVL